MPSSEAFALTDKQIEARDKVLLSGARHCLLYGGARSTKTFLFCYSIATRAQLAPGSRHLISRLHHIDVKQKVMLDTWQKMMRLAYPGVSYALNRSDQVAFLPDGSEVWFGGLDSDERVDKVLGSEYASIFLNEVSQIPFDTVTTARTRLAQNVKRRDGSQLPLRMYYDLNPVGKQHWSYKEFIEGIDPSSGRKLDQALRAHMVLNPIDNPHLPPEALAEFESLPTRARQRYYEGKYQTEVPGALWPLDVVEELRVDKSAVPDLIRVVVAVDPSGSDGTGGDSQGIIVAGKGVDGHAYVLADRSCKMAPAGWARRAAEAYTEFEADKLVAEINYGGAMVEALIRSAEPNIAFKKLTASRGKHVRAEPIAGLYETVQDEKTGKIVRQGRVHHAGVFPELEEQMGMFTTEGYQGGDSPDRVDALVWALTELMLGGSAQGWLELAERHKAKKAAAAAAGVM